MVQIMQKAKSRVIITCHDICSESSLKWIILVAVFLPELFTNHKAVLYTTKNPGWNLITQGECVWLGVGGVGWGGGLCVMNTWSDGGRRSKRSGRSWTLSVWSGKVQLFAREAETSLLSAQASQSEATKTDWLTTMLSCMTNQDRGSNSEVCLYINFGFV